MLQPNKIRRDFPIFENDPGLVYLDSTATSLKPVPVIEAQDNYYRTYSANVHRGIYAISERATAAYESARKTVADFIHARSADEVVFTRGTTEGLNLLAYTIGRDRVGPDSEIVVSIAEHHSNFVPWQRLTQENGAVMKVIDCNEDGIVPLKTVQEAQAVITEKTAVVSLFFVSNVLGTINPVAEICKSIKAVNPKTIVIIDAAQAVPTVPVDVHSLGCDFLVFSGHKTLGPTGIGVLWGKEELLREMPPFQFGGEMIERVTLGETTFKAPPHKFEAGTPPIAQAIGLAAALQYLSKFSYSDIRVHESKLWQKTRDGLSSNKHIRLLGPPSRKNRTGIFTFVHNMIHPHDLAQVLSGQGVCIRAGHHCAMPLHTAMGLDASARASFYIYNTEEDVDRFLEGIHKAEKIFL